MKRNILLIIFYILEIAFVVLFSLPVTREFIELSIPAVLPLWDGFISFFDSIGKFLKLTSIPYVNDELANIISSVIFNILVFVVYQIIAVIITFFVKRHRKKKRISYNLSSYSLNEEEKARFEWKLYIRKFSFKGMLSYLIPTIFILLFLFVRFDLELCINDKYCPGFFNIYTLHIKPFLANILPDFVAFVDSTISNYISFINQFVDLIKIEFIEYIILAVIIIIIYLIWAIFVWICIKINKKHAARVRAKNAKNKYIEKMEKRELKARAKADSRISSKAEDILGTDKNVKFDGDASTISIIEETYTVNDEEKKKKEAAYIDDISTGVVDLGIASTGDEEDKDPITRKIPVFVGDEDVDIVLDKEPYIETIEDDDDEGDYDDDDMPFFEKYSPSLINYDDLDDKLVKNQVDLIEDEKSENNINKNDNNEEDNKKDENVVINEDNVIENEDKNSNYEDDNIQNDDIKNDIIDDSKEIIVEKKNIKPIEPRNKKNIKPINVVDKFKAEDRFKNAKQKYLNYPIDSKIDEKILEKKRNIIRRKHK